VVEGDGDVPAGREDDARLAEANCPEAAVLILQEASR
jgi:ferredoxin